MEIRPEKPEDIDEIRELNERAFHQSHEAKIIDKLRKNCADLLSLVAIENDKIVGHILFSPAVIEGLHGVTHGMGLAPMAVLPSMQKQGIGTQLIKAGIEILKGAQCPFIIVIGHPEYYPRFGFERALPYGIQCQWEGIPDEVFLILRLDQSVMKQISGLAKYRDEFSEAV